MKVSPAAAALGTVAMAAGVVGALGLREATLSTHHPVPEGLRVELAVSAEARGAEPGETLVEMLDTQVRLCRLEVTSDVVGEPCRWARHGSASSSSPAMRPSGASSAAASRTGRSTTSLSTSMPSTTSTPWADG